MGLLLREVAVPLANYPTGVWQVNARSIPDAASFLYFEFARCTSIDPTIWPNETTELFFSLEGSFDGIEWIRAGGFGSQGGIHIGWSGVEAPLSTFIVPLPPGVNRQVRATIEIVNGPLRTQGSIELRD